MIRRNTNKFFVGTAMAVGIVTAAIIMAGQLTAQAQKPIQDEPAARPETPQAALEIGTYDFEAAFQAHPAQKELEEVRRTAQAQMMQAQQEQDQQKMQQAQQQYEQARQQVIQQFQQDVSKALPEVAKAAGVKVIVTRVVYKADDVQTTDITPQLVRAFGKNDEGHSEPPAVPQFPQR